MFQLDQARLRRFASADLLASDSAAIRDLLVAAFGADEEERFTEHDWEHALGGLHFVLDLDGTVVAHASVVERMLEISDQPYRTGYVEAVATAKTHRGAGFGSLLIADVTAHIRDQFELGALGTGRHHFYERLGWLTWRGPSSVRTAAGLRRTAEDDGYILVLPTARSRPFDLAEPISCDWRPGDVW